MLALNYMLKNSKKAILVSETYRRNRNKIKRNRLITSTCGYIPLLTYF